MPDVPQPAQPTRPPSAPPGRAREVSRLALLTVRFLGYLVYVYIAIVEAILVLGFFLRLFGANPNTDFVDFIYRSLDRIMAPFRAIFDPIELGTAPNDVPAVLDSLRDRSKREDSFLEARRAPRHPCRRIRLSTDRAVRTLRESIGAWGEAPEDHSIRSAVLTIVLLLVAWLAVPVTIWLVFG